MMKTLPPEKCRYDILSLGEVMLRLDPGEGRIHTTRSFRAWEGGGEYNVARGLRRCFGKRAGVVTAFADNPVGRLVEDFILQGGVDTSLIRWVPYDGIGRTVRNGLNFTERGFGVRGAVGCSDRGNTAVSQLKAGDIDWDYIFGTLGARWLHTGGIFAALSDTTPEVVIEALKAAKKYGTVTSYDLNYRPSLWKGIGGKERAQEVNREIAKYVDVMIGNEEDFHGLPRFRGRRSGRKTHNPPGRRLQENDYPGRCKIPELQSGCNHPANGPDGDGQRLGRDPLVWRRVLSGRPARRT